MGLCSKCNIVKSTQLYNGNQVCDDCLNNQNIDKDTIRRHQKEYIKISERKNKNDGATTIGIAIVFLIFFSIIFYYLTSVNDDTKQKKEIIKDKDNSSFEYEDYKKRYELAVSFGVPQEDKCELAKQVLEKAKLQKKYPNAVKLWSSIVYGTCSLVSK